MNWDSEDTYYRWLRLAADLNDDETSERAELLSEYSDFLRLSPAPAGCRSLPFSIGSNSCYSFAVGGVPTHKENWRYRRYKAWLRRWNGTIDGG